MHKETNKRNSDSKINISKKWIFFSNVVESEKKDNEGMDLLQEGLSVEVTLELRPK